MCLLQNGELVAQFKATVLLMPNGSDRVTSAPLQKLETEKKVRQTPILQNPLLAVHESYSDHQQVLPAQLKFL